MNTPKCPECSSSNTVFKQKAQQWECGDCESRFVDTQYDARPRRIFLSYPHAPDKHSQLVEDVAKVITAKGHHPWFDKNKIKEGYDWRESITQGVLDADWLIIFMSQKSLAAGGVCLEEVGIALQKSGHETLLTVLLEDEKTVNPPISLTHVQWLDVKDFEDAYPEDRNNPAAMQKWAQWLDERFTRLIRHIERRGDIQGDISALRNRLQPASFVGQIAHSIKGFVGREWVFDEIQHWQHHHRERRTFVIEGAAGIGKSAIAGQLSQQLRDVIGIYFCKHNDATTRDANNLVRTMAFQIASRDQAYRAWLKNKLTESAFEGDRLLAMNAPELFRELIVNAPRINEENKARLILMIDGLDEARDETGHNTILDLVSREFKALPKNIGVVITTRPEQGIVSRLDFPYVLSTDDVRNIKDIENYLAMQFDLLEVFKAQPDAKMKTVTSAVDKSRGVMLYASELVRSIRDGHINPLTPEHFPIGLSGIYHGYMQREFASAEVFHQTSAKLAELIAVSPLPLTEALMRTITNLTKVEFARYIKPLSSLLVTGERNDATTYALFHKSFADWLVKPSRLHDYRLEGDGLKRMGGFLYDCFLEQGQKVKFDSAEIEWGTRELLPLCLPDMALWNDTEALETLGMAFDERGWYRAAIVAQTQVLSAEKSTLGDAHPDTLTSMANLANTLSKQGDLSGARALEEQALAARKAILGDTHPATLISMANLGNTLHKQGDLVGARALQEQALAAKKAILGDEHPSTPFSMANLAGTLFAQGDSAGARALQEQALATRKATLGDKHPDTLNSIAYLALSLKAQGDLAGARALQEQALSANKAMLGDDHPDALTSMANLASTLRAQGDLAGARALEEQVLATKKAILGNEHPSTLISMTNLAVTLKAQGDVAGARALEEQVLALQKATLGDKHPHTITSIAGLANTLHAQGDLAGARALQEQALEVLKATFGDKHPDTMTSMNNLSNILHAQGDLTGSRALQEQVLAAQKSKLGEAHPDTLHSMSNLAGTIRAQGDIDGARALQERVLAARKAMQGDEHPDTLRGMTNLANTLYAQGDLAGARALYEQALTAQRAKLGNEHPSTLISMNNLASTLYAQNDVTGARALFEQVLAAQKAMLGDKHPHTLASMTNLAKTLYAQVDLAGARELQEQALAAQKVILGDNHPNTLTNMANLANTLYAQGDLAGARALQEQVLAAQKALLGDEHPDTLTSMANLAETLSAQGDLAGARALQNQELDVQKETLDDFHPDTLTSLKNLSDMFYKQGDFIKARELQESMLEIYKTLMHPTHPKAMVCVVNIGYLSHQMNDHAYGLKYINELAVQIQPLLEGSAAEKLKAFKEGLTQAIAESNESMEEMYLVLVQFLQHIVELLQDQHK